MSVSPNVDNYTLGKGKLYFNRKDSLGVYEGERSLGNAPEFTFSMSIDKLDHYSSMSGIRAKDASVVTELTAQVSFTLDEITADNLELLFFGNSTAVVQAASDLNTKVFTTTDAVECTYLELGKSKIGIFSSTITSVTGTFQANEVITGGTSAATAIIREIVGNTLLVTDLTGTFELNEQITGGTSVATATLSAIPVFDSTDIVVHDGAYTTFYARGTDYTIDSFSGRILIPEGSTIVGNAFTVTFANLEYSYSRVVGLSETSVEGLLRFVSDNPRGSQNQLQIWRVDLSPDGDTAMIGDDWSTMAFTGEILKDSENHPDEPYFVLEMST